MTLGLRSSTGTLHVPATIDHVRSDGEPVCGTSADLDLVTAGDPDEDDVCGRCMDERPDYFQHGGE